MTSRAKKIAAALAAVDAYLVEDAAAQAAGRRARPAASLSPWALGGRLALMGTRMASRGLARG